MLSMISAVFEFVLLAADPSWSCELTHRDPGIAGTYYGYCSQMTPDGVKQATVVRFIPDHKAGKAAP